jgi:hypothetical protein
MGLIQKWKAFQKARLEKKIAGYLKTVKNPKAIREDRVEALEFFVDLKDPEVAVTSLLQRFEYSLEHGIYDTREKETAKSAIMGHGKKTLPLVKDHLKKTSRIAWPLKIVRELEDDRQFTATLLDLLDFADVSLDAEKVDKNYDILCYLRESILEEPKDLFAFLEAHDERIRFAATEVLLNHKTPEIKARLEPFLEDLSAENTRSHQAVVQAYQPEG